MKEHFAFLSRIFIALSLLKGFPNPVVFPCDPA